MYYYSKIDTNREADYRYASWVYYCVEGIFKGQPTLPLTTNLQKSG
jgi:hypothetical protein